MKRRIYWGLGALIIVLLCVSTFMLMRNTDTSPEKVYKADSSPSPDEDEQVKDNIQDEDTEHEIVDHGDHTHKVPISENEKWPPAPKTSKGGWTYHAELLETNPVQALILQAEERGHWSAEHIPPFPPDDTEAQEYAKNIYLTNYYRNLGYGAKEYHDFTCGLTDVVPEGYNAESYDVYARAMDAYMEQMDVFREYEHVRRQDLWRLTWTKSAEGAIPLPYIRVRAYPPLWVNNVESDYFPDFINEEGKEMKINPNVEPGEDPFYVVE